MSVSQAGFILITILTEGIDAHKRLTYALFLFLLHSCCFSEITWPSSAGSVSVNSWSLISIAVGDECHTGSLFLFENCRCPGGLRAGAAGFCWRGHWIYTAVGGQGQPGSFVGLGRLPFHSWLLCSSKSINSSSGGNHSPFHQPQHLNPFLQPYLQTAWTLGDVFCLFTFELQSGLWILPH